MKFHTTCLLALALLSAVSGAADYDVSSSADQDVGRPAPANIKVPEDIRYAVRSYREGEHPRAGQVGIAVAKQHLGSDAKLPVVIFIHGGGWAKGDKDQLAWQCIRYARNGYVAATVSYRLVDEAPFPACIQDVMEAVRFIKSICPDIAGDPDQIGLQGYSAGAHLALMVALASDNREFHSGTYPEVDSSVTCAFVISAPTDFVERRKQGAPLNFFSEAQNEDPAFLEAVSPLYDVSAGQVPIRMVHGTADELVPSYHYQNFNKRCLDAGVKNFDLVTDEGGGHMFFFRKRKTYQPLMDEFFRNQLTGGNPQR